MNLRKLWLLIGYSMHRNSEMSAADCMPCRASASRREVFFSTSAKTVCAACVYLSRSQQRLQSLSPSRNAGEQSAEAGFQVLLATKVTLDESRPSLVHEAKMRKVCLDGLPSHRLRYLSPVLVAYVGGSITVRYDLRNVDEIRVFCWESSYAGLSQPN